MNLDKFTNKAQEAITNRDLLTRFGQAQVTPEHVLLSLLEQVDGLAPRILQRLEIKTEPIVEAVSRYLNKQPKTSQISQAKDEIHVSPNLVSVLEAAGKEAERLQDQYISIEHLLMALAEDNRDEAGSILRKFGVNKDKILKVLTAIRGNQKVTSQDPEATYEALSRYGRDLTRCRRTRKIRSGNRS